MKAVPSTTPALPHGSEQQPGSAWGLFQLVASVGSLLPVPAATQQEHTAMSLSDWSCLDDGLILLVLGELPWIDRNALLAANKRHRQLWGMQSGCGFESHWAAAYHAATAEHILA